MQDDTNDIQKLLRLKRYETPGPEYFDRFVTEFQYRQRAEMMRAPLWRIAWDRTQAFFSDFQVPKLAYAGAFAAIAISVVGAVSQIRQEPDAAPASFASASSPTPERLALSAAAPRIQLPPDSFQPASFPSTGAKRYVMETRPVSYAPKNSF